MKKIIHFLILTLIILGYSCIKEEGEDESTPIYSVKMQLVYPDNAKPNNGINIKIQNNINNSELTLPTNDKGFITVDLSVGTYTATVTEVRFTNEKKIIYNCSKNFTIDKKWNNNNTVKLELTKSEQSGKSKLIIKELYLGGVQKDDGSGSFNNDQYVILYNNSDFPFTIKKDFALAITNPPYTDPANSFLQGGKLIYEAENWIPSGQAVWHFSREVEVAPYSQIVIAFFYAIDNTKTYSKSINFANAEYFATYDTEFFNHPEYYCTPSELIPEDNYLKALFFGTGNAFMLSCSPGFFIFSAEEQSLTDFILNPRYNTSWLGFTTKQVPTDWIIDGVEVFDHTYSPSNQLKRLTPIIDAGYIQAETKVGYSIYRNVDKQATEKIIGNKEKLIYNYTLGTADITDGSTDPSRIDAEASIKNGAIIIYKDTNNSSEDFHQRAKASLRE